MNDDREDEGQPRPYTGERGALFMGCAKRERKLIYYYLSSNSFILYYQEKCREREEEAIKGQSIERGTVPCEDAWAPCGFQ